MTVNQYYQSIFNCKTYKISLDGGCTCPTRDGKLGTGGCIFCSATGSGDFTANNVSDAKKIVSGKIKNPENAKYIAYFQNFTNTYGDFNRIKAQWEKALSCDGVVGLAVGTRPDCISDECLDYLGKLADKIFVQVELGFQTSNEQTAVYIRRGFKNEVYWQAVQNLHKANKKIHVVTHVIFGLPGDSREQMMETVKYVCSANADGLKIANLYVVRGSDLEKEFAAGKVRVLEEDEYFSLVEEALKIIPENIIIHRLTGDPPKKLLIAPEWCCNKKEMLSRVNEIICHSEHVETKQIK